MVIARKDDKRWVVASYDEDGNLLGWATSRDTCMCWTINCAIVDKSAAERLCMRMERIWPSRIWLVEPAPKTHIDSRTGAPLPADVVRKRGMDAAVAEGFVREQERDEAFGRAHRRGREPVRNKPASTLDTTRPHALASVLRRQADSVGDMDEAGIEEADVKDGAGNDKDEGDDMVLARKSGKKAATVKTGSKAKAIKPVPKMQLRTAAASNGSDGRNYACLCGCGAKVKRLFIRGHVKKYWSQLAQIKAGTAKPEKLFGKKLASDMAPWKSTRGGGLVPTISAPEKLRPEV